MPKNRRNKNIFDETIKLLEDYWINLNENEKRLFIKKCVFIYLVHWKIKKRSGRPWASVLVKIIYNKRIIIKISGYTSILILIRWLSGVRNK